MAFINYNCRPILINYNVSINMFFHLNSQKLLFAIVRFPRLIYFNYYFFILILIPPRVTICRYRCFFYVCAGLCVWKILSKHINDRCWLCQKWFKVFSCVLFVFLLKRVLWFFKRRVSINRKFKTLFKISQQTKPLSIKCRWVTPLFLKRYTC